MSEEEIIPRVHPLRQVSVFILAPLIIFDAFILLFPLSWWAIDLGASKEFASLIYVVSPGANMLLSFFWGSMADKYGRRPPLILGSFLTIPGLALFAFATEPWHLLVTQAIRGIGNAAGAPLSKALVADLAPRRVLGERMGAWTMAAYAAPLIGISVGGPLYAINKGYPFIAAALIEFTCLILVIFAIPETLVKGGPPRKVKEGTEPSRIDRIKNEAREWFVILRKRGVAIQSLSIVMGSLSATAISTFVWPVWAVKELHLTEIEVSLITVFGLTIGLASSVPGGALSDKVGRKWPLLFAGFWGSATGLLYVLVPGMANPFLALLLISSMSSAGSAVGGGAMAAYMYEWVTRRERGRASSLTEFFRMVGITIGIPLVGVIYGRMTAIHAYVFGAILGMITYLVIWAFWKEAPPREELGK